MTLLIKPIDLPGVKIVQKKFRENLNILWGWLGPPKGQLVWWAAPSGGFLEFWDALWDNYKQNHEDVKSLVCIKFGHVISDTGSRRHSLATIHSIESGPTNSEQGDSEPSSPALYLPAITIPRPFRDGTTRQPDDMISVHIGSGKAGIPQIFQFASEAESPAHKDANSEIIPLVHTQMETLHEEDEETSPIYV